MNVLEDRTDLVDSAIILVLALLAVLGDCTCASLEKLLVLNQSQIGLIHLTTHIFEVIKDPSLVLLSFFCDECSILVLIVL